MQKAVVKETSLSSCGATFSRFGKVVKKVLDEGIVPTQMCAFGLVSSRRADTCQGERCFEIEGFEIIFLSWFR